MLTDKVNNLQGEVEILNDRIAELASIAEQQEEMNEKCSELEAQL